MMIATEYPDDLIRAAKILRRRVHAFKDVPVFAICYALRAADEVNKETESKRVYRTKWDRFTKASLTKLL